MERVRVCQLITDLAPAGAERCVYELATRLDRERFDVRIVGLRGGAVAERLEQAGVPVEVLNVRGKWDVLKLNRLVDLLRRWRIDVLHTHLFHADLAGRAAALVTGSLRLIHTVHIAEARFRPWQYALARMTADICDAVIAVSPSVLDHHSTRSGLPRSRYSLIPNGIDLAAYAADPGSRIRLREQWGIAGEETLIAFVGRLDHQKGLDTLLGAMSILGRGGKQEKLVIAGDGPQRSMVESFIADDPVGGHVRLLGFTEDVRGVLSAADVLAIPSRWEGFGLAGAEAMSASLPVIATNVAGLRDVVVAGETALVIEKEDPEALAGRIERLAGDPDLRKRLGQAGRRRVEQHFDINVTVAAHAELYRQIANRR
jgi:glycosyltransferase involved in cell wall biosynthesis